MKKTYTLLSLLLLLVMAACSGGQSPTVIQEGAAETQAAATAFYDGATATAEAALLPTLTPTATGTPYIRPTDNPDVDPETVIAVVGGDEITVEDFVNRVRYERWTALESLRRVAELSGVEAIDIRDPENTMASTVVGYLYTLADAEGFAEDVLDLMIQDRIIHQEYVARGLPPHPDLVNNLWLRLLDVEIPEGGGQPEDFDAMVDEFMAQLGVYTDFSELDLRYLLTVRSEEQFLVEAVGSEADFDLESREMSHILLETEAEAEDILARLEAGEDFAALAVEYSLDESARGNGGALGFFERGEMVSAFEAAAFGTAPGEIVGPVPTEYGFHVIEVLDHEFEYRLSGILLETEADVETVIAALQDGADFADLVVEYSVASDAEAGGDLGYVALDQVPDGLRAALSESAVGDIIGPVETSEGLNIFQVTDTRLYRVNARHILVETEADAEDILGRLEAGEDFAALAAEFSIDEGAQGNGGNLGPVTPDQLPAVLADVVFDAQIGEFFGPVETEFGYHVGVVTNIEPNIPSPSQADEIKALHFQNWLNARIRAVEINDIWREVYPADPRPIDMAPYLGELEDAMNEALGSFATPTPAPEE